MLRGIRNASANWLGKLVMGVVMSILAFSFAIWGIGDIFRGGSRAAVASVGSSEITAEEFRNIYNEQLQQVARRYGRAITPDQARAFGLDRQILATVIRDRALDEWTRRLGLGITDADVARVIRGIPQFHEADGQFSHQLFLQTIRAAGYTESRFVNERRREMVRQHLTDTLAGLSTAPRTLLDAINAFQSERRSVEYVALTQAQAGEIPSPTPEQLASYFEGRRALFRAPEYRRLTILRMTAEDIAKWIEISDEEARRYYDERRVRYVTQGRRHVQQIIFPSQEEAQAAKKRIDGGASFEEIARERGLSETDIDLGMVGRSAFASAPAVAEAVFALPEGGISAPAQSRLGYALVRVRKIEPDQVRSFEEAVAEIRQEITRDRSRTELGQKHDRLEDERAGGASLAEAAQKVGLTVTTIEATDRSGRDPGGNPVLGLPADVDVLAPAFTAQVGVEADALRLPGGGYVWFDVTNITPSRERTLDEVRDRVAARWRDDEVAERLRNKASDMLQKLASGAEFGQLAAAESLTVQTAAGLRRNAPSDLLSAGAVADVFRTPKGRFGVAEGSAAVERVIFRVTDVSVEPLDASAPASRRAEDTLRTAIGEDLANQYLAYIQRQVGVTINADALRRVVGGESF